MNMLNMYYIFESDYTKALKRISKAPLNPKYNMHNFDRTYNVFHADGVTIISDDMDRPESYCSLSVAMSMYPEYTFISLEGENFIGVLQ